MPCLHNKLPEHQIHQISPIRPEGPQDPEEDWKTDFTIMPRVPSNFSYLWMLEDIFFGCIEAFPQRRQCNPLQYSCLENPMDGGAWWASVHGVAKSRTQLSEVAKSRTRLSDFIFTFPFHALEKEMATHASVLAWRIPGMGEPGGLPFLGSHRVGHD